MITYDYGGVLLLLQFLPYLLLRLLASYRGVVVADPHEVVADADVALEDEVHLRDLVLLVVDDAVLVGGLELPGHETEREVVEEPRVSVKVQVLPDLRVVRVQVEETTVTEEDVFEKIHVHYLVLQALWEHLQVLTVMSDRGKSVIVPIVAEMPLNLAR